MDEAVFYSQYGKILINAYFYSFWISPEEFKKYNAYFLHLKYPERCADDNWLHTCEILNRIDFYKTYLSIYSIFY